MINHRKQYVFTSLLLLVSAVELTQLKQPALYAADLIVDAGQAFLGKQERFRALHGVNNGPLSMGETVDLGDHYREMSIPHIRLHDCEWPNSSIVDIHAVFPDATADPADPTRYQFAKTDAYLQASIATGARIVYRLGESIETTRVKHHVHPPKDFDKWADVCIGIIRHTNEGWADGFHHGIQYWEIWNEPENRPAMWSGSDKEYFKLYATTARRIQSSFPNLKVGGPSVGAVGEMVNGQFQPSSFTLDFLRFCRGQQLPLDFFSWHTYSNDPSVFAMKAQGIRKLLDEFGFDKTEIHLNEWNYLPDNDWQPIIGTTQQGELRKRFYGRQGGAEGAAFTASVLLSIQDSPIDVGGFYAGDTNQFGLFDRYGTPKKTRYAFQAFAMLLETPVRVKCHSEASRAIYFGAGIDEERTKLNLMVAAANPSNETLRVQFKNLPWRNSSRYELFQLNEENNLIIVKEGATDNDQIVLDQWLKGPTVLFIRLRPET